MKQFLDLLLSGSIQRVHNPNNSFGIASPVSLHPWIRKIISINMSSNACTLITQEPLDENDHWFIKIMCCSVGKKKKKHHKTLYQCAIIQVSQMKEVGNLALNLAYI